MRDMDLRSLWQQQPTAAPLPPAELLGRVKHVKQKAVRKLVLTNVLLIATCIYISFITVGLHAKMATTYIGAGMVILAMVIYVMAYNRTLPLLRRADASASVKDHLAQLIHLKEKQDFLFRTMLSVYFFMLSAGMFLYFLEVAAPMSLLWRMVTYGGTGAWVLFAWSYLRPRTIRKQQKDLIALIEKLKEISGQLGEN